MKQYILKHKENPKFLRIFEWVKLISITGGAQLIVQVVGLLSGIIVIRCLPTHEYALYTLANTMLGAVMMLSDGGISTGVLAQGSKVWQDKEKLGAVINTGLDLRKKFALGILLVGAPILFYLLYSNGASVLVSVLLMLSLVPIFLSTLSGAILLIGPRLHQDILPLQKLQVSQNFMRLLLNAAMLFIFPFASIAILANGLPQYWANYKTRKMSESYLDLNQKVDPVVRKEILTIVKRVMPGTVYYCFYSQISIWLCSVIGSTDAIAQVGALGRLVMVLGLFSTLNNTLIVPRYSRLAENPSLLLKRFLQFLSLILALTIFIVFVVWLFPTQVLWILGKDYSGLTKEIILNVISSCLAFISGAIVSMYTSRGWILNPVISIAVSLLSIASGAAFLDLSTLQGIFIFNIYLGSIQVAMYFIYIVYRILLLKRESK